MPSLSQHYLVEFSVFFVSPPWVLGVVLVVMGVLCLVWLYKWGNSLITGTGGS